MQLAARGHVARQALLRHQPEGGGARERLARVDHLEAARVRARNASRYARARARMSSSAYTYAGVPNSRGELDQVAAADLEAARLVQPGAERIDMRDGDRGHGRRS